MALGAPFGFGPVEFPRCCTISACVLRPGEKLTDERVINQTGSMVTTNLHHVYEFWEQAGRDDSVIPPFFAEIGVTLSER